MFMFIVYDFPFVWSPPLPPHPPHQKIFKVSEQIKSTFLVRPDMTPFVAFEKNVMMNDIFFILCFSERFSFTFQYPVVYQVTYLNTSFLPILYSPLKKKYMFTSFDRFFKLKFMNFFKNKIVDFLNLI